MPSKRSRTGPRIVPSADCGNSPKNTLLQDITIALAERDAGFLSDHLTEDVRWEVVGTRVIDGLAALLQTLDETDDVTQLTIEHVVSHGRVGAVNGALQRPGKTNEFCDVFEFASAKAERVKTIRSYVIERNGG